MWKPFNKKKKLNTIINPGRIIKIHSEIDNINISNILDFKLSSEYDNIKFKCLQTYDDTTIFIPQKTFEDNGYSIFDGYFIIDQDNKYLINISQFIKDYKTYCNTICKSSETIIPTYIDICKVYTCYRNNILVCINYTDHIDKTDSIYNDLSQLKQIKERLHVK